MVQSLPVGWRSVWPRSGESNRTCHGELVTKISEESLATWLYLRFFDVLRLEVSGRWRGVYISRPCMFPGGRAAHIERGDYARSIVHSR